MNKVSKVCCFLFCLLLLSSAAFAEEGKKQNMCGVAVTSAYIGEAELEDSSAAYSVVDTTVEAKIYDFAVTYKNEVYNWDNLSDISFVDKAGTTPWSTLQQLGVAYRSAYPINEDSKLVYSAQLASSFENTITGDSLVVSTLVGYNYSFSEKFNVNLGVSIGVDPFGINVFPVVGVQYITEGWIVNLGFPLTNVGYIINDQWTIRADIGFDSGLYKLADDSHVAEDGYVKKTEAKLSLFADWMYNENVKLSAGPQFIFARDLKFYTKAHNRIYGSETVDNTWGLSASLTVSF